MSPEQKKLYDQLLKEKLEIIEERDQLVQQLEEDRLRYTHVITDDHVIIVLPREQEEDEIHSTMMDTKFGGMEYIK